MMRATLAILALVAATSPPPQWRKVFDGSYAHYTLDCAAVGSALDDVEGDLEKCQAKALEYSGNSFTYSAAADSCEFASCTFPDFQLTATDEPLEIYTSLLEWKQLLAGNEVQGYSTGCPVLGEEVAEGDMEKCKQMAVVVGADSFEYALSNDTCYFLSCTDFTDVAWPTRDELFDIYTLLDEPLLVDGSRPWWYEPCPQGHFCVLSQARADIETVALNDVLYSHTHLGAKLCVPDDLTAYGSRAFATTSRATLLIVDSTEPAGTERGTWSQKDNSGLLEQDLARDVPGAPRARVHMYSGQAFVVRLVDPASDELGWNLPVPAGSGAFVSDILLVEQYLGDMEAWQLSSGKMVVDLWLPKLAKMDLRLAKVVVLHKDVEQHYVDGADSGVSIAPLEDGWFRITISMTESTISGPATDWRCAFGLAVVSDFDECLKHGDCDEHAECTNTPFGFSCACKDGWLGDGQLCIPTRWSGADAPQTIRLQNEKQMTEGWHLQEVELFSDAGCSTPLTSVGYVEHKGKYCRGNNVLTDDMPSCGAGSKPGKLAVDDFGASAICASFEECKTLCDGLADCVSFDMHQTLERCYINFDRGSPSCSEQVLTSVLGDDPLYTYYSKATLSAKATEADDYHEPALLIDGEERTEWWSYMALRPLGASVDLHVPAHATVGSVRVRQNKLHAGAYRVHVDLPRTLGTWKIPLTHVQYAETGLVAADQSFTYTAFADSSSDQCVDLTCGDQGRAVPVGPASSEGVLWKFQFVPSPCHCKALCLTWVAQGCKSWTMYVETDTTWSDHGYEHEHRECYLLSEAYDHKKGTVAQKNWVSGGVDLVLRGFEPTRVQGGKAFSLQVFGAGFNTKTKKQRIKVVVRGAGCGAAPAETVDGVVCSDAGVCSPPPASSGDTSTQLQPLWEQYIQ
jgi:hypothetical protein